MKSDTELKRDVENELKWEPSVNEAHIGVGVENGIVTLSGHVPAFAEKFGAERAAKRVAGVKAVADELDVKLPGSTRRTDVDIATACVAAFHTHYAVPDDRVKVVVDGGWVTLEGEVDWHYQREAAENAVRNLKGVQGVTDRIKVKARLNPKDIKALIEAAFKRSAEVDARRVHVEAHDGRVVLRGTVRSWTEREQAQQAAWSAPGVVAIENDLEVTPS